VPEPEEKGEKAMEMTTDWKENNPTQHVVNIPNKGYVSNLPEGTIVEVPGYFKDGKMIGKKVGNLPSNIADLVRPFTKEYKMAAEAAVSGDRDLIVEALTKIDPMAKMIDDAEKIEHMVDLMLYYQREWLPAFQESGVIPSLDELKSRKYFVSKKDLSSYSEATKVKYPPREELKKNAIFVEDKQTPEEVGDTL